MALRGGEKKRNHKVRQSRRTAERLNPGDPTPAGCVSYVSKELSQPFL